MRRAFELAANDARSSYTSIQYADEAAEAARKNLDVVTENYQRGATDILDLLDAQNAWLVADLNAADAQYQFLIDLLEMERAINRIDFFLTPADRTEWLGQMDDYFRASGVTPARLR